MEDLVESSERLVEVKNYLNDREDVEVTRMTCKQLLAQFIWCSNMKENHFFPENCKEERTRAENCLSQEKEESYSWPPPNLLDFYNNDNIYQ